MIESKIIKILQTAVRESAGTLPVKYLSVNFKVPSDDKYLEIIYAPNNVENEFLDRGKTYRGILRLLLHWPKDNKGIYLPMQELERIAGFFEKGKILTDDEKKIKVILTDEPNLTSCLEEESSLLLPLTIKYNCFIM